MRERKRKNRTTRNELRYVFRAVGSDLMKVLFMGTPEFAVPSIKAIENDGHEICVVFTQPDRPKGRGHRLTMSPVKEYAVNRGYEVLQPEKVSSQTLVDVIDRTKCDVVVVVAYGQKIPADVLSIPKYGFVNVHASLLPKYRGAAPIEASILNGDHETGITVMYMGAGMDTGDIGIQESISIGTQTTGGELTEALSVLGGKLIAKFLRLLEEGKAPRIEQDGSKATWASKIRPEDLVIDWSLSVEEILNKIRAFCPGSPAKSRINETNVKIFRASESLEIFAQRPLPGEAFADRVGRLTVGCRDGAGVIEEVQPESKGRMTGEEFVRGRMSSSPRRT